MENNNIKLIFILILSISIVVLISCDKKATTPEELGHETEVTLAISPDPATVNTLINFLFEVEEGGEHVDVTMFTCEIEKEGSGNHMEMELHPSDHDAGHYEGSWTFTEMGTYEVHFGFMHDEEMHEEPFTVTVQ
jgi:hypothetical protein